MKTKFDPSYVMAETCYAAAVPPVVSPLKRLMGGLTVLAVVVALILAAAVPARAGGRGDDLAKAVIAALIIGAIIHNSNRDDDPAPVPAPQPVRKPRVPGVCAIDIPGRDGYGRSVIYPEHCLRREGFRHALPGCGREVRIYGRYQRVYSERCLRDAGFRVDGRY